MERLIMKKLLEWKESEIRKPLILTGVRQCGKTYVMQEFGKQYFQDVAYFNFEENERLGDVFQIDFNVRRILMELSVLRQKDIIPGQTLLIFDEVGACPRAVTSLKYFCENQKELHIIAAGSLLGIALKSEQVSFPVGKVDYMQMYPMNFYEFVKACGADNLLEGMQFYRTDQEVPSIYTEPMKRFLQEYFIIGGMPEVVRSWSQNHDIEQAERLQDQILAGYEHDFSKHTPPAEVPKLQGIWDSVPEQLAKENNKFIFSHVRKGARSKDLEDAMEWLVDAGLIYKLCLVEKPEIPLRAAENSTYFKVYMSDIGLLRRKAGIYYRTILEGNGAYIQFKGAMTENYVMTELRSLGFPSWFWRSGNTAEVDFLTEYHGQIIPIEVKSADNTRAKSFTQYIRRYEPQAGFKCSLKNAAVNHTAGTDVYSLPLYELFRIRECLIESEEFSE
jgi:predicted AAA+ superfamily ATPase